MAGSSIQWPVFLLAVTTWTILLVSDFAAANITSQCPPGFVPQPHRGNSNRSFSSNPECVCGEWGSERLVQCDEKTLEAFLPIWGCMTYDSESAELLVGKCFYTLFRRDLHQFTLQLPSNITNLNEFVCGPFGREGCLCGQCKPGFGTSLYEKDLRCVNCTDTPLPGGVIYVLAEIVPSTLFFTVFLVLGISATSAPFNTFIFFSQMYSLRVSFRLVLNIATSSEDFDSASLSDITPRYARALDTLYGVWNLQFFRPLLPLFCIKEGLNALEALAMEYVSAFYPLLLTAVAYITIELHACGFRPIMWCWKPFHKCYVKFRKTVDPRGSVINAFATFFLLSYTKLIFTSINMLAYTVIHDSDSTSWFGIEIVPFFNPTIPYAHDEHAWLFLLSIIVIIFAAIPTILLFVYPCKCFQKRIRIWHHRWLPLRTFMDIFQGCYKNGTDGTWDLRYFSGLYLICRLPIIVSALVGVAPAAIISIAVYTILAILVAYLRPYRKNRYNILDTIMFLLLIIIHVTVLGGGVDHLLEPRSEVIFKLFFNVVNILYIIPLLYATVMFIYILLPTKVKKELHKIIESIKVDQCCNRDVNVEAEGNVAVNREGEEELPELEIEGRHDTPF